MTIGSPTDSQPVIEGLFAGVGDDLALRGSFCPDCGMTYFPELVACRNPECDGDMLSPCALPRSGTLYSFTWQAYQPPPLFEIDNWQPYAIGMIELQRGLVVMGRLDIPRERLIIGMEVGLASDTLVEDTDRSVIGYVFREKDDA